MSVCDLCCVYIVNVVSRMLEAEFLLEWLDNTFIVSDWCLTWCWVIIVMLPAADCSMSGHVKVTCQKFWALFKWHGTHLPQLSYSRFVLHADMYFYVLAMTMQLTCMSSLFSTYWRYTNKIIIIIIMCTMKQYFLSVLGPSLSLLVPVHAFIGRAVWCCLTTCSWSVLTAPVSNVRNYDVDDQLNGGMKHFGLACEQWCAILKIKIKYYFIFWE